MATTPNIVGVEPRQLVETHYEEAKGLFGLIRWWREVRRDVLDEWLNIQIEKVPAKVILNGVEYVPRN